jgi:hypothetical protein
MVGRGKLEAEPAVRLVSIRGIKIWAANNLSDSSPLRRVLERERDEIPATDLVGKTGVWLQLLEVDEGDG